VASRAQPLARSPNWPVAHVDGPPDLLWDADRGLDLETRHRPQILDELHVVGSGHDDEQRSPVGLNWDEYVLATDIRGDEAQCFRLYLDAQEIQEAHAELKAQRHRERFGGDEAFLYDVVAEPAAGLRGADRRLLRVFFREQASLDQHVAEALV